MIFSRFFSRVWSPLGLAAAMLPVVLFLCPVATGSAAPVTFGGHYTVNLPDSWTSKLDPKDNTLGANGPGELTLNAMVATTETSPEALMEKIATRSEEKKAGYKLLEKGTVTSDSGHKAQLHRYQLDSNDGPQMWIDYYFQLTPKEVVLLVFAFPMNSPTPPKKEIQAIFESVKVATTTSKDESWTDSSASAGDSDITGTYAGGKQSIVLKADGTFTAQDERESFAGTFTRDGTTLRFKDSKGETFSLKLDQGAILNPDGTRLIKKTESANEPSTKRDAAAPAAPKTPGTKITFATNCSVELPAGWTAKAVGARLEGKGPNGVTLEGSSIQDANLPAVMALRAVNFKTKVKEVDTDDVSTTAGAKGKLVYYRYDEKSGPTAEIDVFVEVARSQIVTLKFVVSNSPSDPDSSLVRAIESICSSLTVSK